MQSGDVVGGRWQLGHRLGQGAFGQVYQAEDRSSLNLGAAAIKVMHPSTSPAERANFHEEIRKVVAMRHPNLVAYLDSGEYVDAEGSAHLYLVTELCQYSLADYLASLPSGRLTAEQTERLLADMASGLGYLHSRGLLHRDLKPANVLLGGTDWKLGDFGLTRELSATGHYHHGNALMGTPRYMAPELFQDGAASPASDVYAMGVTLHQALTGRVVHEAGTDVGLIVQVTTIAPSIDPTLPPHWRRLIERCVARDPGQRPAAGQLPAVLAESRHRASPAGGAPVSSPASSDAGTVAAFPPVAALATGPAGRFRTGPLIAVAAVLLVGAVAVALANRGPDGTAADTTTTAGTDEDASDTAGGVEADPVGVATTAAATTTTADPRPPAERMAGLIPGPADAPAGYDHLVDPPGSDELCAGVAPLRLAHPGLAAGAIEYAAAAQVFLMRSAIHGSVAEAEAAFDYADSLYTRCHDQPLDSLGTGEVWKMTPVDDVAVTGADELSAVIYETIGGGPGTGLLTLHARVGDVTVQASGTDRAVTVYYAELMIARATGQPVPAPVQPQGDVGSVAPGTGTDAGKVRVTLTSLGGGLRPAVSQWADSHTNADIDTVMTEACDALAAAQTPNEAALGLLTSYEALPPDLRGNLGNDDYAQLVGAGQIFYCPAEIERLGLS